MKLSKFNHLEKKHKNNQKIRKSSDTVRRDKIELVRLSSVRFEKLFKFDSFTVYRLKKTFNVLHIALSILVIISNGGR